ncbi:hypothetical protein ADEAN_000648100 [Angomonas deanei]|uniref:Uncharacterized protein n=1 Tax=Angomonas deanei TaxID=59799 RepID=A0A7G2CGH4_9TRYP|nr:hypothetical protein ADEAN_000648100 [Angomonas deanei]
MLAELYRRRAEGHGEPPSVRSSPAAPRNTATTAEISPIRPTTESVVSSRGDNLEQRYNYEQDDFSENPYEELNSRVVKINKTVETVKESEETYSKILNFSNQKSLVTASLVRQRLSESLGEKDSRECQMDDEFLEQRRRSFFQTIFRTEEDKAYRPVFNSVDVELEPSLSYVEAVKILESLNKGAGWT